MYQESKVKVGEVKCILKTNFSRSKSTWCVKKSDEKADMVF